jgi:hypothetical protein
MRQVEIAGRIPSFLVAVCLGFIALSIVGFGDIIPGNSVARANISNEARISVGLDAAASWRSPQ